VWQSMMVMGAVPSPGAGRAAVAGPRHILAPPRGRVNALPRLAFMDTSVQRNAKC